MKIMREERIRDSGRWFQPWCQPEFQRSDQFQGLTSKGARFSNHNSGIRVDTVLNTKDAENAKKVEEKFIMSPAVVKGCILDQDSDDLQHIPGVMTPTECMRFMS
uniref:Putative aldolase-type TIM barrel n=1 Tax=Helianthus annuus TaxID=4232 RepID=A0A251TE86_HELAN